MDIPPSGTIARLDEKAIGKGIDESGVMYYNVERTCNIQLEQKENTIYIVSSMVRDAMEKQNGKRLDICSPYGLIRNNEGQVIGCLGLEF